MPRTNTLCLVVALLIGCADDDGPVPLSRDDRLAICESTADCIVVECVDEWDLVKSFGDTQPLPDPEQQAAYDMAADSYSKCQDACLAPYGPGHLNALESEMQCMNPTDDDEGIACALWAGRREASDLLDGFEVWGCDELL